MTPFDPKYLPKSLPPNTSHWRLGLQHFRFIAIGKQQKIKNNGIVKTVVTDSIIIKPTTNDNLNPRILLIVSFANHSAMMVFLSFIRVLFLYLLSQYFTLKVGRAGL